MHLIHKNLILLLLLASCSNIKLINNKKEHLDVAVAVEKETQNNDKSLESWFNEQNQEDSASLKQSATNAPFLKHRPSNVVNFWIKYFSDAQKERFQRYVDNGVSYQEEIEHIFTLHGLPKELFYVGLIESGYSTRARSHAGAVGPWQFIKETGKRYGLKINSYADERKEVLKSTNAAAKHFKKLYEMFGTWELALAAYNQGENGLKRRIRKYGIKDFYTLSKRRIIPKETRHYIPKVLAAMHVFKNAKNYNIHIPKYKKPYYEGTKELELSYSNSLNKIAKTYKTSVKNLKKLNPDLRGWYTPHAKGSDYILRVPKSDIQYVEDKNFRRPAIRGFDHDYRKKSYVSYEVKRGDHLTKIAEQFKISIDQIKDINELSNSRIYIGQNLKIPGKLYRVKKGDYLIQIANTHNTTAQQIMAINDLDTTRLIPGQKLFIR